MSAALSIKIDIYLVLLIALNIYPFKQVVASNVDDFYSVKGNPYKCPVTDKLNGKKWQ